MQVFPQKPHSPWTRAPPPPPLLLLPLRGGGHRTGSYREESLHGHLVRNSFCGKGKGTRSVAELSHHIRGLRSSSCHGSPDWEASSSGNCSSSSPVHRPSGVCNWNIPWMPHLPRRPQPIADRHTQLPSHHLPHGGVIPSPPLATEPPHSLPFPPSLGGETSHLLQGH